MKFKLAGWAALSLLLLSGCGTLTRVGPDGQALDTPVWPNPKEVTLDNHRGTYGDMHRIALIQEGATRDDIYQLIGRPHFHEGFHVAEWDYLFYFKQPDGSNLTCQYKILFDKNKIARQFYWHPVSPAGAQCPPVERYVLRGDALFRFDHSSVAGLLPGAKQQLDQLAENIRGQKNIRRIMVYGYTDRLGSADYNLALSRRRAETVRGYLISRGVDAHLIHAEGMGKANPVAECPGISNRIELAACLQPNRRVEIEIKR